MLTFVVSHNSELVSCLVALCIQLYYGRTVRIFVVNVLDRTRVQSGVTPWCGLSTISSFRGSHWDFIRNRVLYGILKNCLIPLDNIRLSDSPRNRTLNPDFPVESQQLTILARASNFGAHSGLFYHPGLLIQTLKFLFSQSSNVTFTSVVLQAQVPLMLRHVGGNVVWVNFLSAHSTLQISNYDMLIQSKLSSFIPLTPSNRHELVQSRGVPGNVLWIPLLRAILGICIEPTLRSHKLHHGNVTTIDIFDGVNDPIINETNHRYDLIYCLRVCSYVLDCVGEIANIIPKL